MSIFGYPMDSRVHTGTLVFQSLRAREYTGGDTHKVALQDGVWSKYWTSWTPKRIAASQWLMSIFGYPMDSCVHTGTLVFLGHRAREYTGPDLRKIALQDRVLSQYWASWTPKWIAASQWLMSIFGYPMDSWVHSGTLVFQSLRAREYTGGDTHKVALQNGVWSQYWTSWTPLWIAASQGLMSIFGYPMDSWVHTGTLVFLGHRAREYTGPDLRKIALQDRVWSQYWASWTPKWIAAPQWLMSIFRVPYGPVSPHRYFGVPES